MNSRKILFAFVVAIVALSMTAQPSFAVAKFHITTPSQTTYTLGWGASQSVGVGVTCDNTWYNCNCVTKVDSGGYSTTQIVATSSTVTMYQSFSAPQSGQGTNSYTYYVSCADSSAWSERSFSVSINYPTSQQWQTYQSQQQATSSAQTEITTANNLITGAKAAIDAADAKIKEASNLGLDVTSANALLTTAQASYTSANTYYTSAQSAFTGSDSQTSIQKAQLAETSANDAKSNANNAKSAAEQLIANYNSAKNAATKAIDDSKNKISNAQSVVDR